MSGGHRTRGQTQGARRKPAYSNSLEYTDACLGRPRTESPLFELGGMGGRAAAVGVLLRRRRDDICASKNYITATFLEKITLKKSSLESEGVASHKYAICYVELAVAMSCRERDLWILTILTERFL